MVIGSGQSIVALLNRFSSLISVTRKSAIAHLVAAMAAYPNWSPKRFSKDAGKVAIAPPPLIKFLDIGTRMGLYEEEGLIPDLMDRANVLRPRACPGIPVPCTLYEVVHEKLGRIWAGGQLWCDSNAWVKYSSNYDFRVVDPLGYIWGLPIIVPTCPRKLFEQGPRKSMLTLSPTHCMPRQAI